MLELNLVLFCEPRDTPVSLEGNDRQVGREGQG